MGPAVLGCMHFRPAEAPQQVALTSPSAGLPHAPDRVAILVAHGMGQQIEHETLDLVVDGIYRAAAEVKHDLPKPTVGTGFVGGKPHRRAQLVVPTVAGGTREVHVYEAYWAPLTEGRVSLRDTLRFLARGGVNGVLNAPGPFRRRMFDEHREFKERPSYGLWLLLATGFLASLVAMHAAALVGLVPRASVPSLLVWEGTLGLLTFLTLAILMGVRIWRSRARRARDIARPLSPEQARLRVAERIIGLRLFGWLVAGGVAFLLGLGVLVALHYGALGAVTVPKRFAGLAMALAVGALVYVAARWWPLWTRAKVLAKPAKDPTPEEERKAKDWAKLARSMRPAVPILALSLLLVAAAIPVLRMNGGVALDLGVAGALAALAVALAAARLRGWSAPNEEPPTPNWVVPIIILGSAASLVVLPGVLAWRALSIQPYEAVALSVALGALPALLAPLGLRKPMAEALKEQRIVADAETGAPLEHIAATALTTVVLVGAVSLTAFFAGLTPIRVAAWGLVIVGSFAVRHFLVQYVGDVAAYVSPHKLDRFDTIRREIKDVVLERARAIYALRDDEDKEAYARVGIVGHSLGSVVAYDALNALLTEEEGNGGKLRVRERTKLLLTFGSPLDKTAFAFATQARGAAPTREALAVLAQPLIRDERFRADLEWVNVYAPGDIICDKLQLYDSKKRPVDNVEDLEASTPLAAHTEFWANRTVWRALYARLTA